ncbi:hypothetical protein [Vibrio tasmaniensis]|uniref:hypothetical protein n=1 Tax=Vibrio tasmaniensis TaxID=212663 RepID=UPI0002D2CC46|nr:hypothetical protein [Vibrio tasmaniensis]OEF88070.1 hypothetical protein A162_07995 [Vibrio tasmaniensis 1F-155]
MKFQLITSTGFKRVIELDVVPRVGESVEGGEVLGVNYLEDPDFVAVLKLKTIPDEVSNKPLKGSTLARKIKRDTSHAV